ncbi:MAG TPA: hypothetical protein VMD99_06035 [Terriglobales bacterium]|nr:hypothetical protein [Terriglobales bacterium]
MDRKASDSRRRSLPFAGVGDAASELHGSFGAKNAPQDDNDDMDDESMVTANLIFAFYLCIQSGIYNIVLNV